MAKIQYVDFDLRIERRENGYRALVLNSPAGQAVANFQLPSLASDLDNLVRRMGHMRGSIRRLESPENEAARTFGASLFGSIFTDHVRTCFESARAGLAEGCGLRLRLRLSDVPELADVPWEFLYDPGTDQFLVLSIETPLVRYIELPRVALPLRVQPPLDILAMISSPRDYRSLDVDREWLNLKKALGDLEKRGLVRLHRLESASLSVLHHQLRRRGYHVFHFIGHGAFSKTAQDGVLLFEDESGAGRPVTGHELGTLFYDYRSSMRLAVLNACEGARTSRTDPFAGVAQSLVQKGIPAVIANQFEITDEAAITLAHEFYSALAEGYPVDAALSEARKSIYAQSAEIGTNIEWGTPVLYMRSPDGYIFDVQAPTPVVEPPAAVLSEKVERQISRLYDDGLEAYVLREWDRACQAFEAVLAINPNYQDTAARLEESRKKARLAAMMVNARQAVDAENWPEAVRLLEDLLGSEPANSDAELLLAKARKQRQITELLAQARRLHHSEKWEAALKVLDQIQTLDPQFSDPEHLRSTAQKALDEIQVHARLEQTYNLALREVAAQNWKSAGKLLADVQALQAGYRETERLRQEVEAQISASRERRQQQEQVSRLYDSARGHLRSRQWEKAIAAMGQVRQLDPAFADAEGIAERARGELDEDRRKKEGQKRVIALYAEVQRLLVDGQAAQALAALDEIQAIAPDFRDRQGIRKKASQALNLQPKVIRATAPGIELTERIGWSALAMALGWALARFFAELWPRAVGLFSGEITFWKVTSILETFGIGFGLVTWGALRLNGLRLSRVNLVLLLTGFAAGILVGQFWIYVVLVDLSNPIHWSSGYALAGLIGGAFTSWVMHRSGIQMNLRRALTISLGFMLASFIGNSFFNLLSSIWMLRQDSVGFWLEEAAASALAGLLSGWLLLAILWDVKSHDLKA